MISILNHFVVLGFIKNIDGSIAVHLPSQRGCGRQIFPNILRIFIRPDHLGLQSCLLYTSITLHQNDILCGEKIGDDWYFHPDNTMTRGQFLICLLAAKNTPLTEQAVIQTNLSNDRELSLWIKPYLQTAIQQKIITESTFSPDEPISFSEAEELLHRTFDPSWKKSALSLIHI